MSHADEVPTGVDAETLVAEITESFRTTADELVPWFVEAMPPMYFRDTAPEERLDHLRALIASRASGRPVEVTIKSQDGHRWTMMRGATGPKILPALVREFPEDVEIHAAKAHTASDGGLLVVTFDLGSAERFDPEAAEQARKLDEILAYAEENDPEFDAEAARDFTRRCPADLVMTLTPLRLHRLWQSFREISGSGGARVSLEDEVATPLSRIVLTACNTQNRVMLQRMADRLAVANIKVHRAYMDVIDDGDHGTVNHIAFVVEAPEGGRIDPKSELWRWVRKDLQRLKWVDKQTLALAYRHDWLTITRAEIITALACLVHQTMSKVEKETFDRDRILRIAERNFPHTQEIVQLFLHRFNPDVAVGDEDFATREKLIRERIDGEVDGESARNVLNRVVDAVAAVLRTNVFIETRYALAMRLDPELLRSPERPELPYGVFFVHGRGFNGFHVRFRDIARGGIRAVVTIGPDQHARELERLYDEVYGLAYAQQLKNKDIPEGGSKAVVLLESRAPVKRSVKAFVDSLLDLITPEETTRARIVDRFGLPELLYLGPDENITPELIEWIVDRARARGYPLPNALMSSKPGAGINHKDYGVTSEGVTVFLDAALRHAGIDPKSQPFRVKITGGPDGDVAGNEIKILHREYGQNARIVGIADGSGSAEDPAGLDHEELLRLVRLALPIARFDRARLGPEGRVVALDEAEGVMLRNTMHNRVVADAFVPAGGRPATMHEGNWRDFLQADGSPSARVIVEGANIYITNEARRNLAKCGVLIFKDSSANKCGVITSSFEIAACMVLDEQEFLEIKTTFVEQVLAKLRSLARREALLLLRFDQQNPEVPMFETSVRLSKAMIRVADAIEDSLDQMKDHHRELFASLVVDHLPEILVTRGGDRIWTKIPEPYLRWIMAKSLATRMIYREGFEQLETMTAEGIARTAVRYLELERERRELARQLAGSQLPSRERIVWLLDRAGILPTMGGQ